jgi:hypothetical protein
MTLSRLRAISPQACILSVSLLSGCGAGGEDGSTTSKSPALPTPTVLTSSNANLSAYIGTWSSDCGINLLPGDDVRSGRNVYKLTSQDGAKVYGTLEQYQYLDRECTSAWQDNDLPAYKSAITLKVLSSTDVGTPTSQSQDFIGTADKVEITSRNSLGVLSTKISFAAFSEPNSLRFTNILPFSALDLTYRK